MKSILKKMSNSLASAKRRRANLQPETTSVPQPQQSQGSNQPQSQTKLTIPAYLSLLESRLLTLEKRVDGSDGTALMVEMDGPDGAKNTMKITDYMEDMDKRFQMLAEEITNMKDIVLSLQRYTMEVNQNLLSQMTSTSDAPQITNLDVTSGTTIDSSLESLQPPIEEPSSSLSAELKDLISNDDEIINEVEEN